MTTLEEHIIPKWAKILTSVFIGWGFLIMPAWALDQAFGPFPSMIQAVETLMLVWIVVVAFLLPAAVIVGFWYLPPLSMPYPPRPPAQWPLNPEPSKLGPIEHHQV